MTTDKKTAVLVKSGLNGFTGFASLYKLSPPLDGNDFVIVSATDAMFSGPETYLFPGNEQGEVTDWGELEGSFRGGLSHKEALRNAGYAITK